MNKLFRNITITGCVFILLFMQGFLSPQSMVNKPIFIDMVQLDETHDLYFQKKVKLINNLKNFLSTSEKLLKMKPLSVMDKKEIPPSGNKHDFMSMGPYWWPDSSKDDGLPYIRKDGKRNPEYHQITDESHLTKTIGAVDTLVISYYITRDLRFASKAAELLRVWFLNDETKMNPNMKHAQFIPGINFGRGIGLIESRYIFKITDAIILLRTASVWKNENDLKITKWFEDYFAWITNHQYGIDESDAENNHGTWYDVQTCAIAIFLSKEDYAKKILEEGRHKRIDVQIESDGKQPLELARTKSWSYSLMNLSAFMHLAVLGEFIGVDLWNYQSPSGGSIRKALDYLLPYSLNHDNWEYKQIDRFSNDSLFPLLQMAQRKYDEELYGDWIKKIFGSNPPYAKFGQML